MNSTVVFSLYDFLQRIVFNLQCFSFSFQQQEQDPTNLYIANLPVYFSEKDLDMMFKDYGTVISTRILRKPDGLSRGVGFARMESKEKCDQIIQAFNGKILPGKIIH